MKLSPIVPFKTLAVGLYIIDKKITHIRVWGMLDLCWLLAALETRIFTIFWNSDNKHGQGAHPCSLSTVMLCTGELCTGCALNFLFTNSQHARARPVHFFRIVVSCLNYSDSLQFLSFCPNYQNTCSSNTKHPMEHKIRKIHGKRQAKFMSF